MKTMRLMKKESKKKHSTQIHWTNGKRQGSELDLEKITLKTLVTLMKITMMKTIVRVLAVKTKRVVNTAKTQTLISMRSQISVKSKLRTKTMREELNQPRCLERASMA